jgi:hypothetical protein
MATKSQQLDDGTVVDSETTKSQKGYANYEKDQQEAQKKMETRDAEVKQKFKTSVEKIRGVLGLKKGGSVSKADMQKAGFYDKGTTKSERQKIVSKATTKPERIAIVEKAFSSKNMKAGGAVSNASKRADGCAIKGKTRA